MILATFKVYAEEGGLLTTIVMPTIASENLVANTRQIVREGVLPWIEGAAHVAVSFHDPESADPYPEVLVTNATQGNWGNGNALRA